MLIFSENGKPIKRFMIYESMTLNYCFWKKTLQVPDSLQPFLWISKRVSEETLQKKNTSSQPSHSDRNTENPGRAYQPICLIISANRGGTNRKYPSKSDLRTLTKSCKGETKRKYLEGCLDRFKNWVY